MKNIILVALVFIVLVVVIQYDVPQKEGWVTTEGELTEITNHSGKRMRTSALIKFTLENGTKQLGTAELFRIPFNRKPEFSWR